MKKGKSPSNSKSSHNSNPPGKRKRPQSQSKQKLKTSKKEDTDTDDSSENLPGSSMSSRVQKAKESEKSAKAAAGASNASNPPNNKEKDKKAGLKNSNSQRTQSKPRKSQSKSQKNEGVIEGNTFVLTGVFHNHSRDGLTDRLKELGGRVTGNVSSRTSYLVHGDKLEDGRHFKEGSKYKKALELGTRVIDEGGINEMIRLCEGQVEVKLDAVKLKPRPVSTTLWTTKHAPTSLSSVIGNSSLITKIESWLSNWKKNQSSHTQANSETSNPEDLTNPAILISGSPGIGKTTVARLLAQKFNYEVKELNASDCRNKSLIESQLASCSLSHSLNFQGDIKDTLLIMDEVDGMSSGDRGGVTSLLQIIRHTKVPIICICNDRQSQKLRSLSNLCSEVKFRKPNKLQIVKRIMEILKAENFQIEKNSVEVVVEAFGNDIRQILTFFEVCSRSMDKMNYSEAKSSASVSSKDLNTLLNHFDAACKLFNTSEMRKLSHKEKIDLAFIDYQMIPLMVHDNYLAALDQKDLKAMSEAADSIALSDVMGQEIYAKGNWGLLPSYLNESCISPAARAKHLIPFVRFPEFFGKASSSRKKFRLASELSKTVKSSIAWDQESCVNELVPLVHDWLCKLLKNSDCSIVSKVIFELGLTPDEVNENLLGLCPKKCEYSKVPNSVKKRIGSNFKEFYLESLKKVRNVKNDKKEKLDLDQFDPEVGSEVEEVESSSEAEEIVAVEVRED